MIYSEAIRCTRIDKRHPVHPVQVKLTTRPTKADVALSVNFATPCIGDRLIVAESDETVEECGGAWSGGPVCSITRHLHGANA